MHEQSLPKALANALSIAYAHAAAAREAVEHRLASIPLQEEVVAEWHNDVVGKASRDYPGHSVDSYPVQTRMSREVAKLGRYREELPQRMGAFARALQQMEVVEQDVDLLARQGAFKGKAVKRPTPGAKLKRSAWPKSWPMTFDQARTQAIVRDQLPKIERVLLSPIDPEPLEFSVLVGGRELAMTARYRCGVEHFRNALGEYAGGKSSTRWPAIIEAIRCDIRWPALEEHLTKPFPWLPRDYVDEEFGLRGSLAKREMLSDLLIQLSPEAARWYLNEMPGRIATEYAPSRGMVLSELASAGLVRVGATMSIEDMIHSVPFPQIKNLFTLAGLRAPVSFYAAVKRFAELRAVRDERYLRTWLEQFLDPLGYLVVTEPPSFTREERLGPRARANVMVSSLVMLAEGDRGALSIFG